MIYKINKKPLKKYGNYFLSFEAPGDEEENNEVAPVEDMTLSPIDDEDTDFTSIDVDADTIDNDSDDGVDDGIDPDSVDFTNLGLDDDESDTDSGATTIYQAEDEPADPDTAEEIPTEEPTDDDATDTGAEEAPVDNGETDQPDGGDAEGDNTPAEDSGDVDAGTEEPASDEGDTGDEETPEEDEDNDFTGVGEDEDSGVTDDDAAAATSDDSEKKGPGLEYDSTRKYNLFQEYMSLYNAVNNYISKLENNVKDDMYSNKVIKDATDKLREIKTLCYDYMMIKFEISTYTQSLVFYQTLIVAVQSVFKLLGYIHNPNHDKDKNERSDDANVKHDINNH